MTRPQPVGPRPLPTITYLMARWAAERGQRPALKFAGSEISFTTLLEAANRVGHALRRDGLVAGDRIGYLGKNSDLYFILLYGAAQIGVVMTPIGWRLASGEIGHILADAKVRLLFVEPDLMPTVGPACTAANVAPQLVVLSALEPWLSGTSNARPDGCADIEAAMLQIYTSGTTGRPKGAVITQRNLIAPRIDWPAGGITWDAWAPDDIGLVAMPVAHIAGTNWGFMGLIHGSAIVITQQFDPAEVLDLISNEGVNRIFIVAAALQAIVRDPRAAKVDFSRIHSLCYGASPMPLPLLRESMAALGVGFCQQYGLTEAAGTIVALGPEDHDPIGTPRMRSAGRAMPGVELRIANDEGAECAAGAVGEILVRAEGIMQGYWNMPEATAKAIDNEGWLRTGDAGFLDDDGYLFICDRIKDMIVTGGENVYPAELESIFCGHPDIGEAAIIGVPHERWGEAVKLVAVPRPGHRIESAEVIAWSRSRMAGFKVPKSVDVIAALPRNPSGKILKRELRAPYWEGQERQIN